MPSTQSSRKVSNPDELPTVNARVTYLAAGDGPVQVRVYPPGSGRATVRPPAVQREVTIRDARPIAQELRLDEQGFELHSSPIAVHRFLRRGRGPRALLPGGGSCDARA